MLGLRGSGPGKCTEQSEGTQQVAANYRVPGLGPGVVDGSGFPTFATDGNGWTNGLLGTGSRKGKTQAGTGLEGQE